MKTPKQSKLSVHLTCFVLLMCSLHPSSIDASRKGHRFFLGPEFYHVHRVRQGGTKQNGTLIGGKLIYDHVKRYKFYWAAEGLFAVGPLMGHTGDGKKIKSCLSENYVEGRLGYTFQSKCWLKPSFTPFGGYGYFWEINKFDKNAPLPIRTQTTYRYAAAGFLTSINLSEHLQIGVNLKLKYMLEPRCTITKDPEFDKISLKIGNEKLQYRIELPVNYYSREQHGCCDGFKDGSYGVAFTPFFERQHYEGQAAYPFDYMRTLFFNYGATLAAFYTF